MKFKPARCPACNKYTPDKCICQPAVPPKTRWKSIAEWPEGTTSDIYGRCRSEDTHDTEAQAKGVCFLLDTQGFGGMRQIFPLRTWAEPIPLLQPSGRNIAEQSPTAPRSPSTSGSSSVSVL